MNKEEQLNWYQKGIPPIQLERAAIPEDGIVCLTSEERERLAQRFVQERGQINWIKFTPASGAASRMFKSLFEGMQFLQDNPDKSLNSASEARLFLNQLADFPFFDQLAPSLEEQQIELPIPSENVFELATLELVLDKEGLNYGSLPKALITFHNDGTQAITALEEHFREGLYYADPGQAVRLHFTISPEHQQSIQDKANEIANAMGIEDSFKLEFSTQDRSTDMIAVYQDNTPVVLANGDELYRPAGHGALLQNLNDLDAEMVFVKNIDNVAFHPVKCQTTEYKKVLAGKLLEWKEEIHNHIYLIRQGGALEQVIEFIRKEFGVEVSNEEEALALLNRPIRIGGMVPNTGAPGGGPFWVKNAHGRTSLQIVEKSQIDLTQPDQREILESSTHFNPVDLVCWIRDVDGKPFDLFAFRNPETGFISEKSFEGKVIRALELPGLWNGSMDGWLTRFVEVPGSTFNPVKTVMNLLDENHRIGVTK